MPSSFSIESIPEDFSVTIAESSSWATAPTAMIESSFRSRNELITLSLGPMPMSASPLSTSWCGVRVYADEWGEMNSTSNPSKKSTWKRPTWLALGVLVVVSGGLGEMGETSCWVVATQQTNDTHQSRAITILGFDIVCESSLSQSAQ